MTFPKRTMCVFGLAFAALRFSFYVFSSFFFFHAFSPSQAATVHVLYMNSSRNIWPVLREQCIRALFTDPQISFFINFFIKNGSYSTIHIFKNYFVTVFSVFSFNKISSIQTHPKIPSKSSTWFDAIAHNTGLLPSTPSVIHISEQNRVRSSLIEFSNPTAYKAVQQSSPQASP